MPSSTPLAYLLTFSTYGTHLPGSAKGYFNPRRPHYGDPGNAPNEKLESFWQTHLTEPPFQLDNESARSAVLDAILEVCTHRSWQPHAVHVRTTHVHAVITAPTNPEKILSDLKAYSTRAIRRSLVVNRRHFWTHHGSTRYLWNKPTLEAAVSYALQSQGGEVLAHYPL